MPQLLATLSASSPEIMFSSTCLINPGHTHCHWLLLSFLLCTQIITTWAVMQRRYYGCPGILKTMLKEEEWRKKPDPSLRQLKIKKKAALTTAWHIHPITQCSSGSKRRKSLRGKYGCSIKMAIRYRELYYSFTFPEDLMQKKIMIQTGFLSNLGINFSTISQAYSS